MNKFFDKRPFPLFASSCKAVLFCLVVFSCSSAAQEIPDSVGGKRLAQVLLTLNESDESKRESLINSNFEKDDEERAEVLKVAARLHQQLGKVEFRKVLRDEERYFEAICSAARTDDLIFGIELVGDDFLIGDVSIQPVDESTELEADGDFVLIVGEDGKTNPICRGVWEAKGYGYIIEVTETGLKAYNYSGEYGWEFEFAGNLLFKPGEKDNTSQMTFHPLQPGFRMTKLDALPKACEPRDWTAVQVFEAFSETMSVYYPFFEERNVDWQSRIEKHRSQVKNGMSERELFEVLSSMLSELYDGHVSFGAEIEGEWREANIGTRGTYKHLRDVFAAQDEIESFGGFMRIFKNRVLESIKTELMGGKAGVACKERLMWGRVHEQVGYLHIDAMHGFGSGGMSQQVEELHTGLNQILTELADTEALIIDVSLNPGGTDAISLEIASHFADRRRIGFSKWPATQQQYRNDRFVTPYSEQSDDAVMYTKPVYLVTNDYTASAAEIFTMCMRSFPHVVTVGKPTEGVLSDVLGKSLPNGWELGISNEVYVDHEGVCYEAKGIPPAIEMDVFADIDVENPRHVDTIKKVVRLALSGEKNSSK